jgi:hypothetical protein
MLTLTGVQVAWQFVKKWAWLAFAVATGVLAILLLGKSPTDLAKTLADINKRHEEEIARIKAADAAQLAEHERNQAQLEAALKLLDDRYRAALAGLDADKQAEIDAIVKAHGSDPSALAAQLAATLGFQVQ